MRVAFIFAAWVLVAGCGVPSGDSLCERYREECNTADENVTLCKQGVVAKEQLVLGTECEDEYEQYVACQADFEPFCDLVAVADGCEPATQALIACEDTL